MKDSRVLYFGDQINILGLQMIFLGNVLAVDDSVENLKVDESVLHPHDRAGAGRDGFPTKPPGDAGPCEKLFPPCAQKY